MVLDTRYCRGNMLGMSLASSSLPSPGGLTGARWVRVHEIAAEARRLQRALVFLGYLASWTAANAAPRPSKRQAAPQLLGSASSPQGRLQASEHRLGLGQMTQEQPQSGAEGGPEPVADTPETMGGTGV